MAIRIPVHTLLLSIFRSRFSLLYLIKLTCRRSSSLTHLFVFPLITHSLYIKIYRTLDILYIFYVIFIFIFYFIYILLFIVYYIFYIYILCQRPISRKWQSSRFDGSGVNTERLKTVLLLEDLPFSPTPWPDPIVIYNIFYEGKASYLKIELPTAVSLIIRRNSPGIQQQRTVELHFKISERPPTFKGSSKRKKCQFSRHIKWYIKSWKKFSISSETFDRE